MASRTGREGFVGPRRDIRSGHKGSGRLFVWTIALVILLFLFMALTGWFASPTVDRFRIGMVESPTLLETALLLGLAPSGSS